MSALCQKSTLKRHHPMSALPPKADIHAARAAHSREPARARWNQPKFLNDFSRARACACAQERVSSGAVLASAVGIMSRAFMDWGAVVPSINKGHSVWVAFFLIFDVPISLHPVMLLVAACH